MRSIETIPAKSGDEAATSTNLDELRWVQHRWLARHGKSSHLRETREQLALMRRWFDSLDTDGSGEVGLAELEDPLVAVGLARSREDVQQLIDAVDRDGSGGVTFDAFLSLLYPERVKRERERANRTQPALHEPKHPPKHIVKHTSKHSTATTPQTSQSASLMNKREPQGNPVAKLFEELQAGKLGDLAVPFPVLITAYRRRMLLNAHMAEDPATKSAGSSVLKALEVNRRSSAASPPVNGSEDDHRPLSLGLTLPSLSAGKGYTARVFPIYH